MNRRLATRVLLGVTGARIAAVPVVMVLILVFEGRPGVQAGAAALFVVAAATDYFDGYLARRWEATTNLGAFLDTTADKLLVTGVLVALVEVGHVWSWAAVVIIGRELVIMGLRGVVASAGASMPPSIWGKWKAAVQFLAIALAIARPEVTVGPLLVDEWVMLVAVAVTIASALEYLVRFRPLLTTQER